MSKRISFVQVFLNQVFLNMAKILKGLFFIIMLSGFSTVYAQGGKTDMIESAYPLKILLDTEKLTGVVLYRMCDWDKVKKKSICGMKEFAITPETKAYENDEEVPLSRAKSRLGKFAEVVYYKGSLEVRSLSW